MRTGRSYLFRDCYSIEASHSTCIWQRFKGKQRKKKDSVKRRKSWDLLWLKVVGRGRWRQGNQEEHFLYDWFGKHFGLSFVCPELEVRVNKMRESKSRIRSLPFWAKLVVRVLLLQTVCPSSVHIMPVPLNSSPHLWHYCATVYCLFLIGRQIRDPEYTPLYYPSSLMEQRWLQ